MRPPIPAPDGKIVHENIVQFEAKEQEISYRASIPSITRLQSKAGFLNPSCYIAVVVVTAYIIISILPIGIRPLRGFSTWHASTIIAGCALLAYLIFVPLLITLSAAIQACVRGLEYSIAIGTDGVTEVAKRHRVFIIWRKILWIITWSDDIFILTFGGGVFIPRHAFRTSQEAEDFAEAARQFHRRARETRRDSKWLVPCETPFNR